MSTARGKTKPDEWQLTGRHVLAMFVAFFGVVFAVNGYFLAHAISTYTGVVSLEPYRKGLAYNERIAANERQTALGWTDQVRIEEGGVLALTISTATGGAVSGLHVTAQVGRPSTAVVDRTVRFIDQGRGRYVADTGLLEPGNWIVAVEARGSAADAEPKYRARRRLWQTP